MEQQVVSSALAGVSADDKRIAEQLRLARASADLRYSAKVAVKRRERGMTIGNYSRTANMNAASVLSECNLAGNAIETARAEALEVEHALHFAHQKSDQRYAARLAEKQRDDELTAVAPGPAAVQQSVAPLPAAVQQAWAESSARRDASRCCRHKSGADRAKCPGCTSWWHHLCSGTVRGVPSRYLLWLLLLAALPTAETLTNYLVYLEWNSRVCTESEQSCPHRTAHCGCHSVYSWASTLGLTLQGLAAVLVGLLHLCSVAVEDTDTYTSSSRCEVLMHVLAMSFGFGPLMYVAIVMNQAWRHDFKRDKQVLRQIGILLVAVEVLPQALIQFYVSVVDRTSPTIMSSLFIALLGGAAACTTFEVKDRQDAHIGSWFFIATVAMRGAQLTGLVSMIALLGCAFAETAVAYTGPGLMTLAISIYESYKLQYPNAVPWRRHLLGAIQVLWFAAAFGHFYLAEHDKNLVDGDVSFDCRTSRVASLTVCSVVLFALLVPVVSLTDPKFGHKSFRAVHLSEAYMDEIDRITSQGQAHTLECQITAIWRYTGWKDQPLTRKQLDCLLWRLRYQTMRGKRVLFGETVVQVKTSRESSCKSMAGNSNNDNNNGIMPRRGILHGFGGGGYASVEWLAVGAFDEQGAELSSLLASEGLFGKNTVFVSESDLEVAPAQEQLGMLSKTLSGGCESISKADFFAYCKQWPNRTGTWCEQLQLRLQDLQNDD